MNKAKIFYFSLTDEMLKDEKLQWFHKTKFQDIPFEKIKPSKKNNWINLADNDFEELLPLADKKVKNVLFHNSFNGIVSNRDEWVYDFSNKSLKRKSRFFISIYNKSLGKREYSDLIKWSDTLKKNSDSRRKVKIGSLTLSEVNYRPFIKKYLLNEPLFNDRLTKHHIDSYGEKLDRVNFSIGLYHINSSHDLCLLANKGISDLCYLKMGNGGTYSLPLHRYDSHGNRQDNITDWGKSQFTTHYKDDSITKEAIFHYTYAVLHYPAYRKKYELNLKREFPRLPFYDDFWKWEKWGKQLMDLHLEYETVKPFGLKRVDKTAPKKHKPKCLPSLNPNRCIKQKTK